MCLLCKHNRVTYPLFGSNNTIVISAMFSKTGMP